MVKITVDYDRAIIKIAAQLLSDNGINPLSVERDMGGDTVIVFDDGVDMALVRTLFKQAIQQHRLRDLAQYDDINILNYTPAQIASYIDNNVTTLTQAKTVLKALAKLNLYLLRQLAQDI